MPLARILTLVPEATTPLFEQLRRMGFTVEVANPNEEQLALADLEIEFAICDQQQVLARAAAIAAQLRAEVVVFPGVIPPLPKPAPVDAEVPVITPAPREIVPPPQEPRETRAIEDKGTFGLQLPAGTWLSGMGEKLRDLGQRIASVCKALADRLRPALGTGLTRMKNGVSATSGTIAERAREYQEKIRLRAAEARVARKQRLEEIERQRAEAAQHTAIVEPGHPPIPENSVARQEQFQIAQAEREKRLAEMERLRAEAREQVAALERARLAAEAEHRKLQLQQSEATTGRRSARNVRSQSSQLRGVFTGVAAASILFIVGMLLANFHPSRPLPGNMTNGTMEQEAPFGGTTVHGPPGVTLGGGTASRNAATKKSVPQATPQLKPKPALKPQPSKSGPPVARKKSQWRHFRQKSNRAADDDVADDVVVRHYAPAQKPLAKNTQQQAGLKHYSDQ